MLNLAWDPLGSAMGGHGPIQVNLLLPIFGHFGGNLVGLKNGPKTDPCIISVPILNCVDASLELCLGWFVSSEKHQANIS